MSLNTYQHIPYPEPDTLEEKIDLDAICRELGLSSPIVEVKSEVVASVVEVKSEVVAPVVEVKSEVVASVAVPVNRLMHDYDNDDIMPDEDDVILDDESDIYEPDEDDDNEVKSEVVASVAVPVNRLMYDDDDDNEVRVYIDEPVSACVTDEDEYNPYTMGWDIILN